MKESDFPIQQEDTGPPAEEGQAGGLSLLQSQIGLDALQSAKDLLISGVSFPLAIRQAAVGALDRAGVGNDKASQLEAEMIFELNKQLLKSVLKKMVLRTDMPRSEVIEEIRGIGVEEGNVESVTEFLYQKRERVWILMAAKVKASVMQRFKDRQTAAQQERLGNILDETMKGGVRAITEDDFMAAWKRVKASDEP
jgi:hypothetical protein